MALPNYSLSNTSKSVIITYICSNKAILSLPLVISGSGENKIFNPDIPDIAKSTKTLDGVKINYTIPAIIEGTLTLNPASSAWRGISNVLSAQYLGDPIIGTLIVADFNGVWTDTYQDFTFLSGFPGHILNERADDIDLKWSAYLPNSINLASYIGFLTGL